MSYITITEFDRILTQGSNVIPAPLTPAVARQRLEPGLTSMASEPFTGLFIMLHAAVPMSLDFGPEPEADGLRFIVGPGESFWAVQRGHRLAVKIVE